MKILSYTVVFKLIEEGGYNVIVPAIPEICTFGETLEEAREMGKDAIRCYLEIKLGSGMHIDLIQVFSRLIIWPESLKSNFPVPSIKS